jgi:autotransporter-associated beta strand protein
MERESIKAARTWRGGILVVAGALLAACGGGGGGGTTRPDPPPATVQPPVVYPPNATFSKHLTLTNTAPAHAAGLTGQGIRIGVVDSGVNRNHPALSGRVVANLNYINSPPNNLKVDDVVGHGTAIAQIIAGKPFGEWPGGIAPGALIVSARIISDKPPVDDGSGQGNEVSGALGLKPIHQDLIDRGARIMNNSWGGLYWTNLAATAPIADEYRPFIIGNDGLVVFATGNESSANPSSMAALPSQPGTGGSFPGADLERGWLAVAALDTDNPTQLASYSNACGVAMRYCLVAPGKVTVTGTDDSPTNPTYWNWQGTSLAAPQVSGAAALVWEAFPYFNNDLVRQTLLGTAKDLGTPGVDATFGYGLLDVGKAVLGPSALDWGDVTANFDNITSTWGNRIVGNGGITKLGTGKLVLAGPNAYAGATRVNGGTLQPLFALPGDTFVGAQGRLELFNASVKGHLDNLGVTAITGGAGHSINGDFHQGANARLAMEVGSHLFIDGKAQLDGGDLQVTGLVNGYVYSQQELLLNALGGVNGTFATLSQGPGVFLDATLLYNPLQVLLDIRRLDITAAALSMGMSAASLSSAERVEGAFSAIDRGEFGDADGDAPATGFLAAAGAIQRTPTAAAAEQVLASLGGSLHAADTALALLATESSRHVLESRLDAVRSGVAQGAWADNLAEHRALSQQLDMAARGWVLGQDRRYGDRLTLGGTLGETRSQAWHGLRRDREHNRQIEAQVYASWALDHGYVQGRLAQGRMDRVVERELFLGAEGFGVGSAYAEQITTLGLQAGRQFGGAGRQFIPYLGVQSLHLQRAGFDEDGAAGFGLSSRGSGFDATQALLGARFERDGRIGGVPVRLQGRAEWQHLLAQSGQDIAARFTALDVWSPIAGAGFDRDIGVLGLGLSTQAGRRGRLGFDLDARHAGGDTQAFAYASWSLGF